MRSRSLTSRYITNVEISQILKFHSSRNITNQEISFMYKSHPSGNIAYLEIIHIWKYYISRNLEGGICYQIHNFPGAKPGEGVYPPWTEEVAFCVHHWLQRPRVAHFLFGNGHCGRAYHRCFSKGFKVQIKLNTMHEARK